MGITYGDYRIDRGDYDPPDEEPVPVEGPVDVRNLSNRELANYIEACDSDFDGLPRHAREALVRLLRYKIAFEPPSRKRVETTP